MTTVIKRVLIGLLTVIAITGLFWAHGFNFDKRGETLVLWLWMCLILAPTAAAFPFKETK